MNPKGEILLFFGAPGGCVGVLPPHEDPDTKVVDDAGVLALGVGTSSSSGISSSPLSVAPGRIPVGVDVGVGGGIGVAGDGAPSACDGCCTC